MSDSKDKRVSMQKGRPGAVVPSGKVDVARPQTVVGVAAALIISGLAAIATGLALHGQHDYLVTNLRKNNPPVTAKVDAAASKVTAAVESALKAGTVTATDITAVGNKAAAVLGDKNVIASKYISDSDRKDQQTKVRDAVSAQLRNAGTVTTAGIATTATSVGDTVRTDLVALAKKQVADLDHRASTLPRSVLIQGIVLTVALAFVAFGAYAGRYYSRWAVPVLWVLATFTSLPSGLYSLLQLGASAPAGYKVATAISALAMVAALGLNFVRPSRAWYEAHRPTPPAGAAPRRGLFAPRIPPPTGGPTGGRPVRGRDEIPAEPRSSSTDRSRTKRRSEPAAPAGSSGPVKAEGAKPGGRPRQASKSRRTEG